LAQARSGSSCQCALYLGHRRCVASKVMPIAHVATAVTLRADLVNAQSEADSLRVEVQKTQHEIADVTRAGSAVLAALEASMVPIMAELAFTRQACKEFCAEQGEPFILGPSQPSGSQGEQRGSAENVNTLEDDVKHLQVDIAHFQHKGEKLQVEERQRSHEISRLCGELSEAYEHLSYEQQCVKHHETCRQFGVENNGAAWAGMGPCGVGRRTIEVRAEQQLREHAEQRGGRLSRDVTKLASDTSQQQVSIAQLGARLMRVKKAHAERERRLLHNHKSTKLLHAKLRLTSGDGDSQPGSRELEATDPEPVPNRPKNKALSASTGKLPQLSF